MNINVLHSLKYTQRQIAASVHSSRNTISEVIKLAAENNLCWPLDDQLTNEKVYTSQICFREVDGTIVFFNEAEAVCNLNEAEPEDLELKSPKQPKRKGKKQIFPAFRSDGSTITCPKRNWKQNSVSKVGNSYRMPFPENIILYLRR